MILPPFLKKGDRIGILSTARKIEEDQILSAVKAYEDWGLEVVTGKSIGKQFHQFAGTDEERAADLQEMLDDKSIKAISCAKGGYGTVRIIDKIDFSKFRKSPKWITGYSDITILHGLLNNHFGIASLHSLMPGGFDPVDIHEDSIDSIRKALFGELKKYEFGAHPFNIPGKCSGTLRGGNMSIVYNLNGTNSDFKARGTVLFLEDIDEYLYHIDRMIWAFRRSRFFGDLEGILIGGMTDMNDHEVPFGWNAEEIILQHCEDFNFPVAFNFPAGHQQKNFAFYLGVPAEMKVGKEGSSLEFQLG